jgi:hypothetical protein
VRAIDWDRIPEDKLALMTIEEIVHGAPMLMADFRDSFALSFTKTGHFIGLSRTQGLQLGIEPYMVDGIWFLREDELIKEKIIDVTLSEDTMKLRRIE